MEERGLLFVDNGGAPYCNTDFGVYHAGFTNHPIYSDITGYKQPTGSPYVTVFWAKLGDQLMYRGFDVNLAFALMEEDFQTRKAGSLGAADVGETK